MSSMQVTDELLYRYAPMAENLWISQLPSDEQIPVHNFSKRFEKRMRKLIKDQRRSPSMRHFVLMTKRVAAIALVISVLSFSCLMTVEAYRVKFIEIVTEVFNNTINFIITPKDSSGTGHVEDVMLGFSSLHFGADGRPMIIEDCITDWLDDNRDYDSAWNKYLVSGRQLELVETVKLKYFGDTGGYFTETKLVNGEWKVTRSNVKEGDFDLEAWKDTYPGQ